MKNGLLVAALVVGVFAAQRPAVAIDLQFNSLFEPTSDGGLFHNNSNPGNDRFNNFQAMIDQQATQAATDANNAQAQRAARQYIATISADQTLSELLDIKVFTDNLTQQQQLTLKQLVSGQPVAASGDQVLDLIIAIRNNRSKLSAHDAQTLNAAIAATVNALPQNWTIVPATPGGLDTSYGKDALPLRMQPGDKLKVTEGQSQLNVMMLAKLTDPNDGSLAMVMGLQRPGGVGFTMPATAVQQLGAASASLRQLSDRQLADLAFTASKLGGWGEQSLQGMAMDLADPKRKDNVLRAIAVMFPNDDQVKVRDALAALSKMPPDQQRLVLTSAIGVSDAPSVDTVTKLLKSAQDPKVLAHAALDLVPGASAMLKTTDAVNLNVQAGLTQAASLQKPPAQTNSSGSAPSANTTAAPPKAPPKAGPKPAPNDAHVQTALVLEAVNTINAEILEDLKNPVGAIQTAQKAANDAVTNASALNLAAGLSGIVKGLTPQQTAALTSFMAGKPLNDRDSVALVGAWAKIAESRSKLTPAQSVEFDQWVNKAVTSTPSPTTQRLFKTVIANSSPGQASSLNRVYQAATQSTAPVVARTGVPPAATAKVTVAPPKSPVAPDKNRTSMKGASIKDSPLATPKHEAAKRGVGKPADKRPIRDANNRPNKGINNRPIKNIKSNDGKLALRPAPHKPRVPPKAPKSSPPKPAALATATTRAPAPPKTCSGKPC